MNWLIKQLATPSTHNAIAAVAVALLPIIPAPYGFIAVGIFALLGVVVPEAGEKAPSLSSLSVAKAIVPFALLIGGAFALSSCANGQPPSAAQIQAVSQSAACQAQALANAVTASAQIAGDAKLSVAGSAASVGFGALCTGLNDTPLVVAPVPVNPPAS